MFFEGIPKVTLGIIIANIVAYFYLSQSATAVGRWLLIPHLMKTDKSWDRFILSGFAHVSFLHLFFNMFTLYSFGSLLEPLLGMPYFFIIYIISIMGGGWLCYVLKKNHSDYAALGASGGVVGVVFALTWMIPDLPLSLFLIPISIPGWIFCLVFAVGSAVMGMLPKAARGGISHEGHLGGAAVGLLFTLFMQPANLQLLSAQLMLTGTWLALVLLVIKGRKG